MNLKPTVRIAMMRQKRSLIIAIATLACMGLSPSPSPAQMVLYAASGSSGVNGHLYILNQANGSVITDVGALVDVGGNPYGLTGLAYNAATNTLYGATATTSTTAPSSLVTINRSTAQVTLVGPFNIVDGGTLSDTTFQPGTGTLFGWAPRSNAIETVNLATGATTQVGPSINFLQGGGALAFNASGTLYAAPDAINSNTLRTVDPMTGAQTIVATIASPAFTALNAMKFNGSTLYGNFSESAGGGNPGRCHLGIINPITGAVTDLGISVNDLDAIAFATPVPEPTSLVLAGSAFAGWLGFLQRRRKRAPAKT
jgi:hypothetical protein